MKTIRPAVIMMARDESDIIVQAIYAWRKLGVRDFYLCDNGSTDDTGHKMRMAWIGAYIIQDPATDWPGRRVINDLKLKAIEDGCNWIFPADADEFLQLPAHFKTIHDWIESLGAESGWGETPYLNIVPGRKPAWQEPQRKAFGVITAGMTISMGNHLIEECGPTIKAHGAYYEHFSIRTFEQLRRKMINYMEAFAQTQFQDHPHAVNYNEWKQEGEYFFKRKWTEITGLNAD